MLVPESPRLVCRDAATASAALTLADHAACPIASNPALAASPDRRPMRGADLAPGTLAVRYGARMAFETIIFDKQAGIARVTMNRPDRLNAMTWSMIEEFLDVVEECGRDDGVRVLVFTGAGRAFSSGDD